MTSDPSPDRSRTPREAGSAADRPVVGFRIVLAVLAGMAFSARLGPDPGRRAFPGGAFLRDGRPAAPRGEMPAVSRPEGQEGRARPERGRDDPEGRRVGPRGRPRQARGEPALRDGPRRRDAADKKDRLSEAEVETLRRWIEAGAGPGPRRRVAPPPEVTQHDVIPILLRRCTVCHGLRQQEGGLDLRTRAAMLKGGKSGPAIVPGKPEESLILKKIRDGEMPPRRRLVEVSVKPIEAAEIDLLARWIDGGAPEVADRAGRRDDDARPAGHRQGPRLLGLPAAAAGRRSRRSATPSGSATRSTPSSSRSSKQKGLASRPRRTGSTLLRRVSFDLTGLPPEPDEVRGLPRRSSARTPTRR